MQTQRNNREQQQQVDQGSSDVEHRESTDPRYQQYNEQIIQMLIMPHFRGVRPGEQGKP